jgi:hypothetical protein
MMGEGIYREYDGSYIGRVEGDSFHRDIVRIGEVEGSGDRIRRG